MAHELAPLPYPKDALEPHIDALTMEIHHGRHHKAYVDNFNKALIQMFTAIATQDNGGIVGALSSLKFNGGGHINHSLFWKILSPHSSKGGKGGIEPTGKVMTMIKEQWGSMQAFTDTFNNKTSAIQGSGWGWLVSQITLNNGFAQH